MRISRPCYDKMHRCPGWAGGGMLYAKVERCPGSSLGDHIYDRRLWKFRMNQCPACRVWVLPFAIRWVDWRYWRSELRSWKLNRDF